MLSSFQSRRTDETGSGGKILRSRRFAVSASSPFLRPKSSPSPENPSFLSSFFTGAGNLLSSLFNSSPSSSSSSSASDICFASGQDSLFLLSLLIFWFSSVSSSFCSQLRRDFVLRVCDEMHFPRVFVLDYEMMRDFLFSFCGMSIQRFWHA